MFSVTVFHVRLTIYFETQWSKVGIKLLDGFATVALLKFWYSASEGCGVPFILKLCENYVKIKFNIKFKIQLSTEQCCCQIILLASI